MDWLGFAAFWGFLAILGLFELSVPAFQQPAARHIRWSTNFGLGVVNASLVTLVPVSAVVGADWAQTHGIGLLNQTTAPWWVAITLTLTIRSLVS